MDELGVDELAIGKTGYWTKWALDEVGMDTLGVDKVGMDELALGRSGCGPEILGIFISGVDEVAVPQAE